MNALQFWKYELYKLCAASAVLNPTSANTVIARLYILYSLLKTLMSTLLKVAFKTWFVWSVDIIYMARCPNLSVTRCLLRRVWAVLRHPSLASCEVFFFQKHYILRVLYLIPFVHITQSSRRSGHKLLISKPSCSFIKKFTSTVSLI